MGTDRSTTVDLPTTRLTCCASGTPLTFRTIESLADAIPDSVRMSPPTRTAVSENPERRVDRSLPFIVVSPLFLEADFFSLVALDHFDPDPAIAVVRRLDRLLFRAI